MSYVDDITIDESALDIEWLRQPNLMLKYGNELADARKRLDISKEKLDFVKAQLDKEIREDPAKRGVIKVTEGSVQSAILLQPEYQEASKEFIEAKYEFELLSAMVKALDAKKVALENLVKLYGLQYFAGPKVPRDLSKEVEQFKSKKSNSRISEKLNKRGV